MLFKIHINKFDEFVNTRQTICFAKFLEFYHWKTIHPRENNFYYIHFVPLLGSIIKIEKINVININFKEIDDIAKKNRALFVKIEPFVNQEKQKEIDKLFFAHGYTHDSWPLTSSSTYMIDLSQPYEKIVANFKSKYRYNLRLAEKKNKLYVRIMNGKEILDNYRFCEDHNLISESLLFQFTLLFNSRAKEIKSETHSFEEMTHMCKSYGEKLWMIYISSFFVQHTRSKKDVFLDSRFCKDNNKKNKRIIAASMFLQTKDILHYWHNGSTEEGRKLFAPTLVIAKGIKLGQKLGCQIFDFEGIYDPRFHGQTKRWKGFTRFKEGFNGEKVIYAWPYIKFYSPVLKIFHFVKMI